MMLNVQKSQAQPTTIYYGPGPGSRDGSDARRFVTITNTNGVATRTGGSEGVISMNINGSDIGTTILKTCDLNQDGATSLAELKKVAGACLNLWDTTRDVSLSQDELSVGLRQLFPAPPAGAQAIRTVNGVAQQVPADELPTPDKQLTKHIFAGADSNKDGLLSPQELSDYLDKNFSQWDRNGGGSLDAQELNAAFGQLAMPD
jgi:Ca2+-binding EF-hand superfamily protein